MVQATNLPAFQERDFADHATQALVPHVARDAGLLEHVAHVRDLDDRLGRVNLAQVSLPAVPPVLRKTTVSPVGPPR